MKEINDEQNSNILNKSRISHLYVSPPWTLDLSDPVFILNVAILFIMDYFALILISQKYYI